LAAEIGVEIARWRAVKLTLATNLGRAQRISRSGWCEQEGRLSRLQNSDGGITRRPAFREQAIDFGLVSQLAYLVSVVVRQAELLTIMVAHTMPG
jgi:hypothetical protein